MPEKATNNSATGCLILIVPTAFLLAFVFVAWPVLLGLLGISAAVSLWENHQWQQMSKQISPIFNQLIVENQGCVTPLDLSLKANLSGTTARRYLETKAKEFGAQRREYKDRGPVYYFLTVSTLGSMFDESEPSEELAEELSSSETPEALIPQKQEQPPKIESEPEEELDEPGTAMRIHPQGIIQSELAKRLDVHSSTIYKRREDSDFSEWTRGRDPEGISWAYSAESKEFYPLEES